MIKKNWLFYVYAVTSIGGYFHTQNCSRLDGFHSRMPCEQAFNLLAKKPCAMCRPLSVVLDG